MIEKFLIAIGLKEPQENFLDEVSVNSVRPSSDNLFKENQNDDIKIHVQVDEVEIKAIRSFNDMHELGKIVKDEYIVCMDIRDVLDNSERRRILDFVTGMAFIANYTMRSINKDGVFLVIPSNKTLVTKEKERLQDLGLYKINV